MDRVCKSYFIGVIKGIVFSLFLLLPYKGFSDSHPLPDSLSQQPHTNAESLAEVAVVAQLKQRNDLRLEPLSGGRLPV